MKVILHSSITISDTSRAILYDEATFLSNLGYEVFILYCNGVMDVCWNNMDGNKQTCLSCTFKQNFLDPKRISNKIKFISLKNFKTNYDTYNLTKFDYNTINDIKSINYRNVQIGLSCLSSYISISRNLNPEIDNEFKNYFDKLLYNSALITDLMHNAINEIKPDLVYCYNGRMLDSRPVWEVAKYMNIPFRVLEAHFTVSKIKKVCFKDSSCFSIPVRTDHINQLWDDSTLSIEDKISIGEEFFIRKKKSLPSGDVIYTNNQKLGSLPDNWDVKKVNISIFTSSEDEFASVGEDFDSYSLFANQLVGIEKILTYFQDDDSIHFYVRIHPNLSNIEYSYHVNYYKLNKFKNITLIEPNSKISSYSLIDNSEKIIVFGSTIGIEACYWKKPVILLAGALYYNLDVCYIPKSENELMNMIKMNLQVKNVYGAYKYGFLYHDSTGTTCDNIDCNLTKYSVSFFGLNKEFIFNNWNKILGSKLLYYIFMLIVRFLFKTQNFLSNDKKLIIPFKEQIE